jgi:hypothetical protein
MTAFTDLASAIDRYLLPTLERLSCRESERAPAWYGGNITYDCQGVELRLVYEFHDLGLGVSLGTALFTPGHDYSLYTTAAGISSDDFREACGGWRPGYFQGPDFEKALSFVAATLPTILPRQAALQQGIEEQKQAAEKAAERERRRLKRASRKRPT